MMSPTRGVLALDKPAGITSAAAVARVKRLLPRGTKIGHAGSLDPFATGILLLLIGSATNLLATSPGIAPNPFSRSAETGIPTAATSAAECASASSRVTEPSSRPSVP